MDRIITVIVLGSLMLCFLIGFDIKQNIEMRANDALTSQDIFKANIAMGAMILFEIVFVIVGYIMASHR